MLGVLGQLAFSIEVPADDVTRGRTLATMGATGIVRLPSVTIRSGKAAPEDAFATVEYRGNWFWIADGDFNSKLALHSHSDLVCSCEGELRAWDHHHHTSGLQLSMSPGCDAQAPIVLII